MVFPAHAGMVRRRCGGGVLGRGFPRTRGDGPKWAGAFRIQRRALRISRPSELSLRDAHRMKAHSGTEMQVPQCLRLTPN